METQKFIVKPKPHIFLFGGIFFALCTWVLYLQTSVYQEVFIFHRMLHLSAEQAPYFFWALTIVSGAFSALGFGMFVSAMIRGEDKFVEITEAEIIIPPYGLASRKRIRFLNIRSLKEMKISGTFTLEIKTETEKAALTNRIFQSNDVYEQIKKILIERSANVQR